MTALSLILTASAASLASPRELPAEVLGDLLDDAETAEAQPVERARALRPHADDPAALQRAETAAAMGNAWPDAGPAAAEELRRLARDTSDHVRISAAVGLARAIERASAPERIDLVCTWAVSDEEEERLALARALTWSTPVFVADLVLEQLAIDASAAVRASSLAAAARHFHESSAAYARIVGHCTDDAEPSVRQLARALMVRART